MCSIRGIDAAIGDSPIHGVHECGDMVPIWAPTAMLPPDPSPRESPLQLPLSQHPATATVSRAGEPFGANRWRRGEGEIWEGGWSGG